VVLTDAHEQVTRHDDASDYVMAEVIAAPCAGQGCAVPCIGEESHVTTIIQYNMNHSQMLLLLLMMIFVIDS
jgi:hypothetical protein